MIKDKSTYHAEHLVFKYLPLIIIILLQVGFRIYLSRWDFYMDDACITFRYPQNIIAGWGFVYNYGEHVLGTTTPLYSLLLCLPMLFGVEVWNASRIICIGLDIVNLFLLYIILMKLVKFRISVVLGVLFYAITPHFTIIIMRGMEYVLVSFLVLFALWTVQKKERIWTGIILGLSLICRIDMALFVGVLLLGLWWKEKRIPLKEIIVLLITISPWIVFTVLYFGSPVPVTVTAKILTFSHDINPVIALNIARYTFGFFPFPLLMYLIVIIIGIFGFYKKPIALILLSWGLLHVVFNLFFSPYHFIWYYLPAIIPFSFFWAFGWDTLIVLFNKIMISKTSRIILVVLLVMITISSVLPEWISNFNERLKVWVDEYKWGKITSIWVQKNIPNSAVICTGTPGFLGIFTRNKILDTGALLSPEVLVLKRSRSWEEGDELIVKRFQPDIIFHFKPEFAERLGYIPIKKFNFKPIKKEQNVSELDTFYANPKSKVLVDVLKRIATSDTQF